MFGNHAPVSVKDKGAQSPLAVFTRGLQVSGRQWKFEFPNGYGASVINDGYGADRGLYELGVLHDGHLTYSTPITDDVLGYLTADQVTEALDKIAALTADDMQQEAIRRLEAKIDNLRKQIAEHRKQIAATEAAR